MKELTVESHFPQNCTIACAIPLIQDDFLNDIDRSDKQFAGLFISKNIFSSPEWVWNIYEKQVAKPAIDLFDIFKKDYNVTVVEGVTRSRLNEIFKRNSDSKNVVILIAHYRDDSPAVELFDGFCSIDSFTEIIPLDFHGLIDLCACSPTGLFELIDKERPSCTPFATGQQVTPAIWFSIYRALFQCLSENDFSYEAANNSVLSEVADIFISRKG